MAAVLAGGDGAALSYRSAAELSGIRDTARSRIDVTVPRHRRGRPGVEYHRAVLAPDEVTVEDGIPTTNPVRTFLDLAAVLTPRQFAHALNEAEIRRLASPLPLDALIARLPGRRGTTALKRAPSSSERSARPSPRAGSNGGSWTSPPSTDCRGRSPTRPLGPYEPDALWSHERLVVELDSYGIHTTRHAFEWDRERDRTLQLMGYRVVRITWRQLHAEPQAIAHQLRTLLAIATADPRPR